LTWAANGAKTLAMQGILLTIRHVALAALILRALLPSGWMPDAQAGLTICAATLGVIHHDGPPGQHDGKSQQEECPFAAAAHAAPAPGAPQLALPAIHAFAAATDQAYAVALAARFTPQSPRAPPQFA
jgi:hypothetical protein